MAETIGFFPTHDEMARQNFVGALKGFINFGVEGKLEDVVERSITPAFSDKNGAPPKTRDDLEPLLEQHPLYQYWSSMTFHSQNLMWNAVDETTQRTLNAQVGLYETLEANTNKLGSLTLADEPVLKAPISTTEIHRQPGGYWREQRPNDLTQALAYTGTVDLYRNAKGMGVGGKVGSDSLGRYVASIAEKYAPGFSPKTVLDMGCGTGEQTLAYKRLYPDAAVAGIDCARPFVRYAHGFAESEGLTLDYAEMNASETTYEDESFDFITSIIMFHETSAAQARDILKECWRLLKPGGLVLHLDVPYHANRISLTRQVTNHWQVRYNGEPFWTGFTQLDMAQELADAGFEKDSLFTNYEKLGAGEYFFFGGRKA